MNTDSTNQIDNVGPEPLVDRCNDLDLPMSANYKQVELSHFMLDLTCKFQQQLFDGSILYFGRILTDSHESSSGSEIDCSSKIGLVLKKTHPDPVHCLILDCYDLDVSCCESFELDHENFEQLNSFSKANSNSSVLVEQSCMEGYKKLLKKIHQNNKTRLDFRVDKHSLWINLSAPSDQKAFSHFVVKIQYKTCVPGPCLMWAPNQDERTCVFTVGHLLNNRSLFPAQDTPHALTTWHCRLRVEEDSSDSLDWTVLVAGDTDPVAWHDSGQEKNYHFSSDFPMPAATFALAIGRWSCTDVSAAVNDISDDLPYRAFPLQCHLYSPYCLTEDVHRKLSWYLPKSLKVVQSVLGSYPLRHLNVLIVPHCFDSMGMACPSLILLSQSVLSGQDFTLLTRVSHELCHTWFGITSGPRDWTEEWLNEGLCCYLEDIVHAQVLELAEKEAAERLELRSLLKLRLLRSEVSNSSEELQTLRPNQGKEPEGDRIKNGLNPESTLIQVHYLKGFFLLQKLENLAGREEFLSALRSFLAQHLGKLFSSQELLDWLFQYCPKLRTSDVSVSQVCREWLDIPGLPQDLSFTSPLCESTSSLVKKTLRELSKIRESCGRKRRRLSKSQESKSNNEMENSSEKFLPEQLLLLLELVMEEQISLTTSQMAALRTKYTIDSQNAEVLHAWCELVINQRTRHWYGDLQKFLMEHQAFGVYLYGEMMISEQKALQQLARSCFDLNSRYMPESARRIVKEMVYPS